jgi:hypothetical protein
MAMEAYADVAAALSQTFEKELYQQFNREATFLSIIPAKPATDKTLSWDVEFTGLADAGAVLEGSDVDTSEMATDKAVPATLPTALYRSAIWLTDSEIKKAAISMGSPDALIDILGERILGAGSKLASRINKDLFSGTGTNGAGAPNIIGMLGGAVSASGVYAGIDPATYVEWKSPLIANGGSGRPLTVDLLNQAEEQLFLQCGRSPDFIMTTSAVRRGYSSIFETVRRVVSDGMGGMRMNAGATELFYQGQPVIRDKDAVAGSLIMGVSDFLGVEFLPPLGMDKNSVVAKMATLQGTNGTPGARLTGTSIPFEITPLAKNGNSVKFMMTLELQLKVRRRNAFVVISDIA